MRLAWVMVLIGCGTSGEPIQGDIALDYGGDRPDLVVGTAVTHMEDANNMLVQLGTDEVDCDTYLDNLFNFGLADGHYVYFVVPKAAGAHANVYAAAVRADGNSTASNASFDATVTIDAVEPRVTGSMMFDTTDDDVGTISVSGTFDVHRCF